MQNQVLADDSLLSQQVPDVFGTKMAAAFLFILPLILILMLLQRWFISGIEPAPHSFRELMVGQGINK